MSNGNIDFDKFNELINKIDSTIGDKSPRHNDTLMAQGIIMARGKELRNEFRNISTYEKYDNVIEYLKSLCPNLQEDKLRFALFREGFIGKPFIDIGLVFLYIFILILSFIFIIFYLDIVIAYKILLCLISLFTSLIPSSMIDNYLKNNRLTLYFGLGHNK